MHLYKKEYSQGFTLCLHN